MHLNSSNFPLPLSGKTGWPWTEEILQLPHTLPDGSPWPKISIVTPSYNQGEYLEETIRSVLLQSYPNLEYIIIDGGSLDGSVEIIKKYEPWLTYWISEPDRGQSHAINKGFALATGEIMAWINSDDLYSKHAFLDIIEAFRLYPKTQWIAGKCIFFQQDGKILWDSVKPDEEYFRWFLAPLYMQPGIFWKKTLWEATDKIDESLHFSMDHELWLQFTKFQKFPVWLDTPVAYFRLHAGSKTVENREKQEEESVIVSKRYGHLIKSRYLKLKIWVLRREKASFRLLSNNKPETYIIRHLMKSIIIAPWLLLKRKFYSKAKNLVLSPQKNSNSPNRNFRFMSKDFSVIIPLYNKEKYIQRAVGSVLQQTVSAFELIIVDDGSTDNSYDVASEIRDPRIRIIRQGNTGEGAARNRGIKEAKNDLLAFLDADDEWKPDYLENISALVVKYPACVLYATGCERFQTESDITWPTGNYFPIGWHGIIPDYLKIMAKATSPFNSSSTVAKRSALNKIGGFPEGVTNGADIATWIRCSLIGDIAYLHKPHAIYHLGTLNSVSNDFDWRQEYYPVKVLKQLLNERAIPKESCPSAFYYIAKFSLKTAEARFQDGEPVDALTSLWSCRLSRATYGRVIRLLRREFLPSVKKWLSKF